jgi:hypothetical protein
MKATCPSQNRTLTPPEWKLRAAFQEGLWGTDGPRQSNCLEFGVR